MTGHSIYAPTGIKIKYTHVDLKQKLVTSVISINNEPKLTITINTDTGVINKIGHIDEIIKLSPDMDEESYMDEIKHWSETFIHHNISDPESYFEGFLPK
ncbi:hypothetical protein [Lysinibacillus piscis]|uniref:Uncharacterized protein n=1 Tax=Lysinibacillus piscis TaxID=2518931 RepID=A0ABQ5NFN3_9BACI|nr:hypothetical protein [Lysinibacillus sp. KH24]GLC87192.1 hypothetical protein LYSBPC_03190 [Lysinibacillus sp. KH24]